MADFILINGDIRTMDPLRPRVTALASSRGRVTVLGDDSQIRALAGPSTRVCDGKSRPRLDQGPRLVHRHLQ